MIDWGKLVFYLVEKMPGVVWLALVVFVFVPETYVPEFADHFRKTWRAEAFWSLFVMTLITVVWLYKRWRAKQTKQQEEALAAKKMWGRFIRLQPKMQMFVIDLFFSGRLSATVRSEDPMVTTLTGLGFLAETNREKVSLDDFGELVVTVTLSQQMLDFMNKYSEEFRKQADRIKSSRHGFGNLDG